MGLHTDLLESFEDLRLVLTTGLDLLEEDLGDREEGLVGPGVEPVDGTAVDQRWEQPHPYSERVTNWGEGQTQMKIGPDIFGVPGNRGLEVELLLLDFLVQLLLQILPIVLPVEIWDLTCVQEIV